MCWASYGMGLLSLPLLLWLTWVRPWRFLVKLIILCALLLAGCATQTSEELYELARACGTKQECPEEWDKAHKREMHETRPKKEGPRCPSHLVEWKDWTGSRCITRAEFERALRQLHF